MTVASDTEHDAEVLADYRAAAVPVTTLTGACDELAAIVNGERA
jgi:hypothetical protein